MAGLAATRLFAAARRGRHRADRVGAAARRAWTRAVVADRMVAFLVLLYVVYMLALVICGFGLLLRPLPRARRRSR